MSKETMQSAIDRAQHVIEQQASEVAKTAMRQRYHFMGSLKYILLHLIIGLMILMG